MSFAADLSVIKTINGDIDYYTEHLAVRIDQRLVYETPIDTGAAKANWIVSIDRPDSTQIEAESGQSFANPGAVINHNNSVIRQSYGRKRLYIQNNLPYITALNDGHSQQAPSAYIDTIIEQEVHKEIQLGARD